MTDSTYELMGIGEQATLPDLQETRRRPWGGVHSPLGGRSDARPRQGRDRAHGLPLPRAGLREWKLPRPHPAAEARRRRTQVREEGRGGRFPLASTLSPLMPPPHFPAASEPFRA